MKPLKKRIREYMLQVTGTLMIVVLAFVVCVQIFGERRREYEKSIGVLDQIKHFIVEHVISEERETGEEGGYSNMFSLIQVNSDADYYVISEKDGKVLGTTVDSALGSSCEEIGLSLKKVTEDTDGFYEKINGSLFYCVFRKIGNEFVGRCVDCGQMYQRIPPTAGSACLCSLLIISILTYVVSRYMNRYVIDGIYEINDKLSCITEGDMDVKIDIRTSEEFSELSDYINTMVGSLSDSTSKISYVLSKTNMFIGVYEYRKGARLVHCTEYIPRIFSLELDEWRLLTSDYELFEQYIDKVRMNPYHEEQGVYILSEEPEQYVKLEEMEIGSEVFGVVIDVTEDILKRRKIEAERDVDLLTGLYNRRGMETQMSLLLRSPEKLGYAAFVMIDADGLKGINDTFGHELGDAYLKKIGGVINNFGIQSSLSARIGGDEFVLFLYDYEDKDELLNTVRTIEYIQGHSSARLNENLTVPLQFSFGYCMMRAGMSYEELLKTADERMYENKRKRKAEKAEKEKNGGIRMSYCTYIASDYPLPSVRNVHDLTLSVNEALAMGITDIPEPYLQPGFDRDEPDVILYSDRDVEINTDTGEQKDGDYDDDFALYPAEGLSDLYTEKKYAVYLEWWRYTEGRAKKIIEYIKENLEHTDEVEIWHIWMGAGEAPTVHTKKIPIADLSPEIIGEIDSREIKFETVEGHELTEQYRYVITK